MSKLVTFFELKLSSLQSLKNQKKYSTREIYISLIFKIVASYPKAKVKSNVNKLKKHFKTLSTKK